MIQELVNAVFQISVVLVISLIAYLFAGRNRGNFFHFIGFVPPPARAMSYTLLAALIVTPLSLALFYFTPLGEAAAAENMVAGKIREAGLSADTIGAILIVAFLKTALSEEILFRGLIAKRLINWLGLGVGNIVQAVIFGAIHLLIFVVPDGPGFTPVLGLAFFGMPALVGWIMAQLNETVGKGSIAPGWILHGIGNAVAYPVIAFL